MCKISRARHTVNVNFPGNSEQAPSRHVRILARRLISTNRIPRWYDDMGSVATQNAELGMVTQWPIRYGLDYSMAG